MNMKSIRWVLLLLLIGFEAGAADKMIRLDINSATVVQLAEHLPGIGPAKAQRIVAWRNVHGPFTRIDDLIQVKGIGPKTVERLRALIVLGSPEASRQSAREHQQRESQARLGVRNILAAAKQAARTTLSGQQKTD